MSAKSFLPGSELYTEEEWQKWYVKALVICMAISVYSCFAVVLYSFVVRFL